MSGLSVVACLSPWMLPCSCPRRGVRTDKPDILRSAIFFGGSSGLFGGVFLFQRTTDHGPLPINRTYFARRFHFTSTTSPEARVASG